VPATPFTDPAAAFDDAPLSPSEIDRVREAVRSASLPTITAACIALTADQNRKTRYDLDQFFNEVGEGTVEMDGGQSGVKFSQPRDRIAIRIRLLERLGLSASVSTFGRPTIFTVANGCRGM
jgi:hypothetical protein